MEPEVLPVFYYNDMLLSNIGDTIGLNLFEPRYLLMCQRLATDPRFLFMPNYEDYRCRPGDVGFVVRITGLWPQGGGRTFGVQGSAVTLAAVSCTWEEPDTQGLHYAQYWPLDAKKAPLLHTESCELVKTMLRTGWVQQKDSRLHLQKAEVGAEVFFSSNWPDRAYLSAFLPSAQAERSFADCWTSVLPDLMHPRFSGEEILEVIQRSSDLQQRSVALDKVMNDLRFLIVSDPSAMEDLKGKDDIILDIPKALWAQLLSGSLQLAKIYEMHVRFVREVQLEPELIKFRYREPVDGQEGSAEKKFRSKTVIGVLVTNGFNVDLRTRTQDLAVTEDSAETAKQRLNWKLNRLRLSIVQRARQRGQRPLATLEDDVSRLVCSFVAVNTEG
eukprot:s288_g16.t1